MPPAKIQDESIVVVDKFEVKSGGDRNFCPVNKIDSFMKKGIMKEFP